MVREEVDVVREEVIREVRVERGRGDDMGGDGRER